MTDMVVVPRDALARWFDVATMNGLTVIANQMDAVLALSDASAPPVGEGMREKVADDLIEAALESAWPDIMAGGTSGHDGLDVAVARFQLATGAAHEAGAEKVCLALLSSGEA